MSSLIAFVLADRWRTAALGLVFALLVSFLGLTMRGREIRQLREDLGAQREIAENRGALIERLQDSAEVMRGVIGKQNALIDTLAAEGNRAALRVARAVEQAQGQRSETTRIIERVRDAPPPMGQDCEDAAASVEWGRARIGLIDSLYTTR